MKDKMDSGIKKIIKPRKDSLRIYFICANCEKKAEITEPKNLVDKTDENIIVR